MARTGIYFYKSSIDKCLRQIDKAQAKYEKKVAELLERLGELGKSTAFYEYHKYQLWADENDPHTITVTYHKVDDNTIEILGNGNGICFLEFGAGTLTDTNHPFKDNVPFSVTPGSWSKTHAGQYASKGYWVFGGRVYQYVEPQPGMYEAYKAITQQVYQIAKEVFG